MHKIQTLIKMDLKDFEVELSNPIRINGSHAYNSYKTSWIPTGKLHASKHKDGLNVLIFTFQAVEDQSIKQKCLESRWLTNGSG